MPRVWFAVASALFVALAAHDAAGARIYVTTTDPGIGTGACSLQEAIYSSVLHDTLDGTHGVAIDATDQGNPPDHFVTTGCVKGDGNDTIVLPTKSVLKMTSYLDGDAYNPLGPTATPIIFSTITIEGYGATLEWTGSPQLGVRLFAVGQITTPINTPNGTTSGTGNLTLKNVYIKGFHAIGGAGTQGGGGGLGAGGAIYVQSGTLTVENSTFDSNSAQGGVGSFLPYGSSSGGGGGIWGRGGGAVSGGAGGGGGGSKGDGGFSNGTGAGGGGGGGTVFSGGNASPSDGIGGSGGLYCGGGGGDLDRDQYKNGHDACAGGGGGGGGAGGNGGYGGGGGGGYGSGGGNGGFGGGGGGDSYIGVENHGGNGGFGGGGGALFCDPTQFSLCPGHGGTSLFFGGTGEVGTNPRSVDGESLGGAIFNDSGTVTIQNSTFYNNSAVWLTPPPIVGDGTAAYALGHAIFSNNGQLTILNSTISNPSNLPLENDITVTQSLADIPTSFTLDNTIVTGCGIFAHGGENISESFAGNLIQHNNGCGATDSGPDPQLGPLQDNGGFTPTMAIPFGGAAMSAADPATSLAADQRGTPRPEADGYDVGAYEICRISILGHPQPSNLCGESSFAGFPTSPLTLSSSGSGIVTPTPGTYNAPQNTVVLLSAVPATGYYFKNWTGNVTLSNKLITTIIIGDQAQSVTANFQLHDFSLAANPTTFTLPLGGATATSGITATALGDFADKITLAANGHPAGVAASLSANPLTPVVGTPASSTITMMVGPSVTPQSFTESVTGNSTGLSGPLTHSAQLSVNFTMTAAALANIINQDYALGCIDNSGIVQSLIAKVNAFQLLAGAGHIQGATNVLTAFQYEVQAQTGQHIATTCTDPVGGNQFYTGQTLITDAQSLQATLGTQAKSNPIMGWVRNSSHAGIAGTTVNVLNGKNILLSATTDEVGFYYLDATPLTVGTNYTANVTLPKGYKSSTPASQALTGSRVPTLVNFVLN